MAYYDDYYGDYSLVETPFLGPFPGERGALGGVQKRMLLLLISGLLLMLPLFGFLGSNAARGGVAHAGEETVPQAQTDDSAGHGDSLVAPGPPSGVLSPVFTPEVRYWEPQIVAWSQGHGVDPNLAAIIMQIESCGDPQAVSHAGAQGLFQVMPFHFAAGENTLDPDTNASRGLAYFVDRLNQTNGDIGRAFAGYNGGHVAAGTSWDNWAAETQRYYVWSTGIYNDIISGATESETLSQWLQAGGASLCRQAAQRLGI